jgi:tRNA uridine 5-carboxymethylaminomethyl modification enzyme
LIAGLNAGRKAKGLESWSPARNEAYIGVMIDDLVTMGTLEPYRMFTSRAEYRLQLREDNADLRLTATGHKLGLVAEERLLKLEKKRDAVEAEKNRFKQTWLRPGSQDEAVIEQVLGQPLARETNLLDLLRRPETNYQQLAELADLDSRLDDTQEIRQLEIQARYDGYIERQLGEIERQKKQENTSIPISINYQQVRGLSSEVQQKLEDTQPETVGQAARIPGVTPAAISLLLVHLKRHQRAA